MGGFLDKMSSIFFREVDDEEEDTIEEQQLQQPVAMPNERKFWNERENINKAKKPNLMTIPGKDHPMEMILIKASSYNDLQDIAAHIKARRIVVCNFEEMDKETAQRMVDFLSGAVFALEGQPKKVSSGTFVFSSKPSRFKRTDNGRRFGSIKYGRFF